eukprot:COSAG01_NODE_2089_length_8454_cov_12.054339_8_plen_106_part_00
MVGDSVYDGLSQMNNPLSYGEDKESSSKDAHVDPSHEYILMSELAPSSVSSKPPGSHIRTGRPRREGGGARGAERLGARPQLRPTTATHTYHDEGTCTPAMVVVG